MDFKPRVCYLALVPKPSRRTLDRSFRGLYSVVILLVLHVYEYILHVTVAALHSPTALHSTLSSLYGYDDAMISLTRN